MSLTHRHNNILAADASVSDNATFGNAYTVTVYSVGAVASAASSDSTPAVDSGHSFVIGDKVLIWDGTTATFVADALTGVAKAQLTWASATPTISKGDQLINLGPDSGSGATPAYTASKVTIYSDANGGDAVTNSQVTSDTQGNYSYYYAGDGMAWELVRDASGTVSGLLPGWTAVIGRLNIVDYGAGQTDDGPVIQSAIDSIAGSSDGTITHSDVYVPPGTYTIDTQITLKHKVSLRGHNSRASTIQAGASWSDNTALIALASGALFNTCITGLLIDCNSKTGSIGIQGDGMNEGCVFKELLVHKFKDIGMDFVYVANAPQNYIVDDISLFFDSAAATTAIGLKVDGNGGQWHTMNGLSCDVTPGGSQLLAGQIGFQFERTEGVVSNVHCEDVDIGVQLGSATYGCRGITLLNVKGASPGSGSAPSDVVKIISDSDSIDQFMINTRKGAYTNTINDVKNSITNTDTNLMMYQTSLMNAWRGVTIGDGSSDDMVLSFKRDAATKELRWDESAGYFNFNDTLSSGVNMEAVRFTPSRATAQVTGDFALHADWGDAASVAIKAGSRDSRFQCTVTSAGTGQGSAATIVLTFKDGAYSTKPWAIVSMNGGTGTQTVPTWVADVGGTTLTITYTGTVVDTKTYTFEALVMG